MFTLVFLSATMKVLNGNTIKMNGRSYDYNRHERESIGRMIKAKENRKKRKTSEGWTGEEQRIAKWRKTEKLVMKKKYTPFLCLW